MKKTKFEQSLHDGLDTLTPSVLDQIKESKEFYVAPKEIKQRHPIFSSQKLRYTFASFILLFILVFSISTMGTKAPVVASTVTIDINPSILIELDEEDYVISVDAINDDGNVLLDKDITYKGITLDKAVEYIIEKAYQHGYIIEDSTDNVVLISVGLANTEVKERLENTLETRIKAEIQKRRSGVIIEKGNVSALPKEELNNVREEAKDLKISVAKVLLINQIIDLDDTYTTLELKDYSVRELYNLRTSLENPDDIDHQGKGNNNK